MKKTLLCLFALLLSVTAANAQNLKKGGTLDGTNLKGKLSERPATRAYGEEIFTYAEELNFTMLGTGQLGLHECAIYVPSIYAGKQISEFGFLIIDASTVSDVKAWVSSKLPSNVETDCEVIADVANPSSYATDGYMQGVTLTEPYTIPEGGCYVGYSFNVTSLANEYGQYPIATTGSGDAEGGLFLKSPGYDWEDLSGYGYGNLLTQVLINGDYPDNAARVDTTFPTAFGAVNGTANAQVKVYNRGANGIVNLSYVVKNVTTGEESEEQTVKVSNMVLGESQQLSFPIQCEAEIGEYEYEITVTKVNGSGNESVDNTSKGSVTTLSRIVDRKVVEEEFTATGCTYCTRGIAGMKALADKYPDRFVGIAVHGSVNYYDPMQISDYNDVMGTVAGFPSALLNRIHDVDPYFGSSNSTMLGIVDDFEALMNTVPEAEVIVKPVWNEDSTVITVNSDVTFLFNSDKAPYAMAYVLVADGLHGTEYNWTQANYYSGAQGAENEPYIYEWVQKGRSIPAEEMVYDHVAVAAQGVGSGIKGSISAPLVAEDVQTYTTEFDLTDGLDSYYGFNLLQDKTKLKVVAMLINTETNEIVNADEKEIESSGTVGINNASSESEVKEVARYSVDGARISAPVKGINIVKMSDGTTRKVMIAE